MGASAGVVIVTHEGIRLEHTFRLGFQASNNEAEYEALLAGLKVVLELGARDVEAYTDSRLVVNQIQGTFEAQDPRMRAYLQTTRGIMEKFCTAKVYQISRTQNRYADSLATLASSTTEGIPRMIRVELIPQPSITVTNGEGTDGANVAVITTSGMS